MLLYEKLINMGVTKEKSIKEVIGRMYGEGKINIDNAVTKGVITETEKEEILTPIQ